MADGGAEALRFDSVQGAEGKSLKDYLTSGWIDGLLTSTIRPGTSTAFRRCRPTPAPANGISASR